MQVAVSEQTPLARRPILTYASFNLHNWVRIDEHSPIVLGNTRRIHNFLGGMDEESGAAGGIGVYSGLGVPLTGHTLSPAPLPVFLLSPASAVMREARCEGFTATLRVPIADPSDNEDLKWSPRALKRVTLKWVAFYGDLLYTFRNPL